MGIIDVETGFGFYPYRNIDSSVDSIERIMAAGGIDRVCTLSMRGIYYNCFEGNDETYAVCSKKKNLIPVATLDPRAMVEYEAEINKRIKQGFRIFRMFPDIQGWPVEGVAFERIICLLNDYRMPLIIRENPYRLFRLPLTIRIPIIFTHTHYYRLGDIIPVLRERENFYAESRHLVSPDAIEFFVKNIGAHRLVFGSNLPVESPGGPLLVLKNADVTEKERELISCGNMERILGIED